MIKPDAATAAHDPELDLVLEREIDAAVAWIWGWHTAVLARLMS